MGRRLAAKPDKAPRGWRRTIVGLPLTFIWWANRWWVEPLLHRRMRHHLAAELQETLAFLFQERGGRIIENPVEPVRYPQLADVIVAADGLIFYFWKIANPDERGVSVKVAPVDVPNDSQDLSLALMTTNPEAPVDRRGWISLRTIAPYLRSGFDSLKLAFSRENFEVTKQRIRHLEIHGSVVRT